MFLCIFFSARGRQAIRLLSAVVIGARVRIRHVSVWAARDVFAYELGGGSVVETCPQCMLGGRGVMTEEDSELLRLPAD